MKHIFSRRSPLALAAFFAVAGIVSCDDDDDPIGPGTPSGIAVATSPPATAQVATAVPGPSVTVTDAGGGPAVGVRVNFDVTGGGGALQFPVATTDEQGIASSGFWQIGPTVGVNTATAEVGGLSPLTFTVTSTPGPASRISFSAGNAQEAPPGSALPNALAVRVTDAGGNPKPGETVTFTVLSGGGSITGATATTNAQGIATSGTWTIGSCRGQAVRAQSGSLGLTFTSAATGQPALATGGAAVGALETTDCQIDGAYADEYALTTAAEPVNITLTAATFDALLNLSNAAATVAIATNDNSSGTNSAIKLLANATTKTLTATSAVDGQTGPYTLNVAATSADVATCETVFIEPGVTTNQSLTTSDCTTHNGTTADGYMVFIPAGGTIQISMSSNPIDALIEIYSPTGALVGQRDALGVSASSEVLTYTAPTAGFHKVVAAAYGLVFDDEYGAEYGAYVFRVVIP